MMSAIALKVAVAAGAVAAGTAVVTTGVVPNGLEVALQHVPAWTHAHSVLESLQQAFSGGNHPGKGHAGPPQGT